MTTNTFVVTKNKHTSQSGCPTLSGSSSPYWVTWNLIKYEKLLPKLRIIKPMRKFNKVTIPQTTCSSNIWLRKLFHIYSERKIMKRKQKKEVHYRWNVSRVIIAAVTPVTTHSSPQIIYAVRFTRSIRIRHWLRRSISVSSTIDFQTPNSFCNTNHKGIRQI